jgi:hypothetical protein
MEEEWSTLPGERSARQLAAGGSQRRAEVPLALVHTQNGGGIGAEELADLFT